MIKFDEWSGKYFIEFTPSNVVALDPHELEDLGEQINAIIQEETSKALQAELDFGSDDCESGACKI